MLDLQIMSWGAGLQDSKRNIFILYLHTYSVCRKQQECRQRWIPTRVQQGRASKKKKKKNKEGPQCFGKCWYIHDLLNYESDMKFDIPITYPTIAPEIIAPELSGKTAKIYMGGGGGMCLTNHFKAFLGQECA